MPIDTTFISTIVTQAAVPSLLFFTLYNTTFENALIFEIWMASALSIFIALSLAYGILKYKKAPIPENLQLISFPNSGNMGLPISVVAFGSAGLSVAILFFSVCSLLQNTLGLKTVSKASSSKTGTYPILIATSSAILCRLFNVDLPDWSVQGFEMFGALTVPLMLFSLGYTLASINSTKMVTGLKIALCRFSIGFGSAVIACYLLNIDPAIAPIITLQMTMPCAVIGYIYVARFTPHHADAAASAVLISTILFLVFLPVIIRLAEFAY